MLARRFSLLVANYSTRFFFFCLFSIRTRNHDLYRITVWQNFRNSNEFALLRTSAIFKSDTANGVHFHANVFHLHEC